MKNLPSVISSSLGNILEWYDFGLFTIFSTLFSKLFFPTENPQTALIATIGIFSIGFLCRPIGALLFGYLGDKRGRANTLRLSVLMITLPTLLISFLPSYQQIGIAAPICLTLIRMWQGISIGGEYSGNLIYLAEIAPKKHRALFTSFASMGANFGLLLAALIGLITSSLFDQQILEAWGWRIPYLISGLFCLFIYQYRLKLRETDVFIYLKNKMLVSSNPFKLIITRDFNNVLRTFALVCMGSTFYYFCFIYIPIFISQKSLLNIQHVSLFMTVLICLIIITVPIAGYLCDAIGRRKMLLFNSLFICCFVIPGFYLLQLNYFFMLGVLIIFALASSLEQGTTPIALIENFPPRARYTGVALGYNLGNGLLGGTVSIICEWLLLITHNNMAPAFYIAFCAAITLLVVFFFVPETREVSLKLPLAGEGQSGRTLQTSDELSS